MHETLNSRPVRNRSTRAARRATWCAAEALERRTLMNIDWINEGTAGNDSDGFAAAFGADAELARGVLRGVIRAFEDTLSDFNYQHPDPVFRLTFNVGGPGFGGGSGITSFTNGRPRSGAVVIGAGNVGNPHNDYFLDPSPDEHAEYNGPIVNAFSAGSLPGSPAHGRHDFYSAAAHEVAHVLGMANTPLWNSRGTATTTNDPLGAGRLWTWTGPSVRRLMTSYNGTVPEPSDANAPIHTAVAGSVVTVGSDTWRGADDLGNPFTPVPGSRRLIPDTLALMYRDAYGYVTADVQERPTFHAQLDEDLGTLFVRGSAGVSSDVVRVWEDGGRVHVSVDIGSDVDGTGPDPGGTSLPAYTASFPAADVERIVIRTGEGSDFIHIDEVPANIPVTVQSEAGADTIHLGEASNLLDGILSRVNVEGGIDNDIDRLILHDGNNGHDDTYTVSSGLIERTSASPVNYTAIDTVRIDAGAGDATFEVKGFGFGDALTINAGPGDDDFVIGTGNLNTVSKALTVQGDAGADTVTLDDHTLTTDRDYVIERTLFTRVGFGGMSYNNVETITLEGSGGENEFHVNTTPSGTTWVLKGNGDDDTAHVAFRTQNLADVDGAIDFRGGADANHLVVHDTASTLSEITTIHAATLAHPSFGGLTYTEIKDMAVHLGAGNDTIRIESTAATTVTTTVNGNGGADRLEIANSAGNLDATGGRVVFNGGNLGNGTGDVAILWDDLTSAPNNYTIAGTTVSRSGFGGFVGAQLESLVLEGTTGINRFDIDSSIAVTPLTIRGNANNDRFNIAAAGDNLTSILGALTLDGGAGTDTVEYSDTASIENDAYTMNGLSVSHAGMATVTPSLIENVILSASAGDNDIAVVSTTSGVGYTVNGGGGSDEVEVAFDAGDLTTAPGAITYNGGAGTDTAELFDDLSTAADSYTITAAAIAHAGFGGLTYDDTVETVTLFGSSGNNTFDVNATSAGTLLVLNGWFGGDTFNVGDGDIDSSVRGNVSIVGGGNVPAGATDVVVFNDALDGIGQDIYNIADDSLVKLTGGTTSWSGVERVTVNGSSRPDIYNLMSATTATPLIINGAAGNDQFFLCAAGTGDLTSLPGTITINGQEGTSDTITVHDSGSTANDAYTLSPTNLTHAGFGGLTYATVERITLNASSGPNTIDLSTAASCPLTVNAAGGTDTINVNETSASADVSILASAGNDTVRVNPDGVGQAVARFVETQRIGALSVFGGGRAILPAGADKVLTVTSASITGNGALDLNDNDLIVDYTGASPLAAITALLTSGYNAGAWNGPGIHSSTAASTANNATGIAEASDLFSTFPATFSGQGVDATSLLLKYTAYGDTNLDGAVNLSDFNRLAANFGQGARRWIHGDANFDGTVNLSDFNRLAANFGAAGAAPDLLDVRPIEDDAEVEHGEPRFELIIRPFHSL